MQNERAWAEIDLSAISANIGIIRRQIGARVRLMAVVKADGYGHGAAEVARAALRSGADYLGVANCEEGLELRRNGINARILILGYTPTSMLGEAVRQGIALTVFEPETAERLSGIARDFGKAAVVHIKLDTGMNRLGFTPGETDADIVRKISELPGIYIEGVFTHFAMADGADLSFTREQANKLETFAAHLNRHNVHIPMKHAANSAATLRSDRFFYDMVRIGIALYGLYPSAEAGFYGHNLKPALSLKSRISRIKKVASDETIGYGCTYRTPREAFVATVPLGYADGYSRALSNKAEVLIRGRRAPVIGRICMDQFMIDITEAVKLEAIKTGDIITLIGEDCGSRILTGDISNWQQTIDHEVVCGISKRVPRIYTKMDNMQRIENVYQTSSHCFDS